MDALAALLPLAIAIGVLWLVSRGLKAVGNRQRDVVSSGDAMRGIGGWLLFLILSLIVIGPLTGLGRLGASIAEAERNFPVLGINADWQSYVRALWLLQFAASALSIAAGWGLLRGSERRVVTRAQWVLWLAGPLASAIATVLLPWFFFGNPDGSGQTVGAILAGVITAGIWHAYLARSRRVKNTYDGSEAAVDGEYIAAGEPVPPPTGERRAFGQRLAGMISGPGAGLFGLAIIGGILAYVIAVIAAAVAGIEAHWGGAWAAIILVACFFFRFSLPVTVGAFFGAWQVWGWPWFLALLFAAPGLAFLMPGLLAAALVPLLAARERFRR